MGMMFSVNDTSCQVEKMAGTSGLFFNLRREKAVRSILVLTKGSLHLKKKLCKIL